jgi:hypothetical protein
MKQKPTSKANFLYNTKSSSSLLLVQLGHDSVSRVRNNGAEDTSNVTSSKGDNQLLSLGALGTRLGNNVPKTQFHFNNKSQKIKDLISLVDEFDCPLKAGKLHHGIWDLPHPQWH